MILFLFLSIIFSALLYVILKKFVSWKVETVHGIVVNYFVAASCSFLVNPTGNYSMLGELKSVWPVSALIGFLFIIVFFIIAQTTQKIGVAVASVASKMSMVIPITAGIFLYHENLNAMKLAGIILAVPAVILTSKPSVKKMGPYKFNLRNALLPVLLFVGAGMVDTAIKISQYYFMTDENRNIIIMSIFGFAGIFGTLWLIYDLTINKKTLSLRSIGGGILLGTANYFSLYFLLRCLSAPGSESSTIFAIVNVGVVLTSLGAGMLMFNETINNNKKFGIALAVIAIILLSYK